MFPALLATLVPMGAVHAQDHCRPRSAGAALIVLDRSSSMEGHKWDAARRAIHDLLQSVDEPIDWGLLLFAGGACNRPAGELVVPIGPDREDRIRAVLYETRPSGNTAIAGALLHGLSHIEARDDPTSIILITDGQDGCQPDLVAAMRPPGTTIHVVGFGAGVEQDVLARIAEAGSDDPDASPYLADDADALSRALLDIGEVLPGEVEVCNGVDDDCDTLIDEGQLPEVGAACATGRRGVCRTGYRQCLDGELSCIPETRPMDEACNGLDDDCDGETDEHEADQACATGLPGVCAEGRRTCVASAWGCQQVAVATAEACDGLDNDCDGRTDERVRNACGECGPAPTERCDGEDEDCDGDIDEQARCPGEQACHRGACRVPCSAGECVEGICEARSNLCLAACEFEGCPDDAVCDPQRGRCVAPCADGRCDGAPGEDAGASRGGIEVLGSLDGGLPQRDPREAEVVGCTCDAIGGGSPPPGILAVLVGLWLARPRRRALSDGPRARAAGRLRGRSRLRGGCRRGGRS